GSKREVEISARVAGLLGRLAERLSPSLMVIACNTASTVALGFIRPVLNVPVVGTVPAIKPAAARSRTKVIGVLGTEATVRQPYIDDLAARFAADCLVLRHGAPDLVEAAEAKLCGRPVPAAVCRAALAGLLQQPDGGRMDVVVLACTHFPLLREELAAVAPPGLQFMDGADGIARRVAFLLQDRQWPQPQPSGRIIFTGDAQHAEQLLPALAQYGLTEVEVFGWQ
ncbi:MAG: aspartate/glutamate racemase family protein, partial [Paracoccaceae bacterium]